MVFIFIMIFNSIIYGSEFLYGDVSGDGALTSTDSAMILQYVLNGDQMQFNDEQMKKAKVLGEENITATDGAYVLQRVLNDDIVFPCEKEKVYNGSTGVWWWDREIITTQTGKEYLDFCEKQGIDEIHLYSYKISEDESSQYPFSKVRSFIKDCNTRGIKVSFLAGDSSWIREDKASVRFNSILETYNRYQSLAEEDEKFYGIHFDVEPQALEEYKSAQNDEERLVYFQMFATNFLPLCYELKNNNDFNGVIELDIPAWFEERFFVDFMGNNINLLDAVALSCDTMSLMSYKDGGQKIFDFGKKEIEVCKKYNCKITFGALIGNSNNTDGSDFQVKGRKYLDSEMVILKNLLRDNLDIEYGVNYHHIENWYNLQDEEL